ncbi:MAG: cadherin-like domain-containing protein, partial [Pseudomonadales bacterium]|nr:cadherin-like domain-containing protein [Pseudomonadales bacterium]
DDTDPDADALDDTDVVNDDFTVSSSDGTTHVISITVNGANDGPVANDDSLGSFNEDTSAGVDVLSNDIDVDASSSLSITEVDAQAITAGGASVTVANGTVALNVDGVTLTFTPDADYNGGVSFNYTVSDGSATDTGTVTGTVDPVNDVPTFTIGTDQTVDEGSGAQIVAGFISDGSPGPANESTQTLTYNVSNDNNALFATQPAIDASGQLTYRTTADLHGSATVTVSLSDDGGTANGGVDTSGDQTFTITITAVADTPNLTVNNAVTTDEDTAVSLGITTSLADTDGSETLQVQISGLPAGAELSDGTNTSSTATTDVTSWTIGGITVIGATNDDSDFTLTVTSTATEGSNASTASTSQDIAVTVNAIADTPNVNANATVTTDEDTQSPALGITASLNDTTNELLTVEITGAPSGSVISDGTNSTTSTGTAIDISPDNGWTLASVAITPPPDDNTDFNLTVTAIATEINGGSTASFSTGVAVTVNAVNDAPVLTVPAAQTVNEDVATPIGGISVADVDSGVGDSRATLGLTNGTINVTASGAAVVLGNGTVSVSVTGTLTDVNATLGSVEYTGDLNFNGSDTMTVDVDDGGNTGIGGALTDSATIGITVTPVNDAPTVDTPISDVTVAEDSPNSTVDLSAVFTDVDILTNSDTLTLTVA